jgi:hypothetical protein
MSGRLRSLAAEAWSVWRLTLSRWTGNAAARTAELQRLRRRVMIEALTRDPSDAHLIVPALLGTVPRSERPS